MDSPEVRTYHGQHVVTIMGKELIEQPDYGVQKCCDLCALYGEHPTTGDPGCTAGVDGYPSGLMCGVHNSFYVEANDAAWDEYTAKLVVYRMDGKLKTIPSQTLQEKP
jgi:hypothetical protein